MKRTLASFFLSLSLCLGLTAPAFAAESFSDVPESYWAVNQIRSFADQGIINGLPDGTFDPDGAVTREAFAKMLVLTFNSPLQTPEDPTFTDVAPDRWSYPYVEAAKDYLTGYSSPGGYYMAFHPEQPAVREDIAVALVRMLGLTGNDARDPYYAQNTFRDAGAISPELVSYISVAAERGLINGYSDGTFRPSASITRAEVVTMLDRAAKRTVTDMASELFLETSVSYSDDGRTAYIEVRSEADASVQVDGHTLQMTEDSDGKFRGVYTYVFEREGTSSFSVFASKQNRRKTDTVTATYVLGSPEIVIYNCPETAASQKITIEGRVNGVLGGARFYLNDRSIPLDDNGEFSKNVVLTPGENTFRFRAVNSAGEECVDTRTVVYQPEEESQEVSLP